MTSGDAALRKANMTRRTQFPPGSTAASISQYRASTTFHHPGPPKYTPARGKDGHAAPCCLAIESGRVLASSLVDACERLIQNECCWSQRETV